jgi:hypothetical protein
MYFTYGFPKLDKFHPYGDAYSELYIKRIAVYIKKYSNKIGELGI